jgi:beta-1,4-mannosyl-glycoprotein beta-1,4-N-acetylglucosaminyltransferase
MRIYDTFLFGGELDLLEHRLRETCDLVDVFVLVEAAETFRGQKKPLAFKENRARFAWADAKLRPLALDRLGPADWSPWRREAFQRNALMLGLRDAADDDIVLIADADEIVSRELLARLRAEGLTRPHRLALTRHYEYLDQIAPASACCPPREAPFPFVHPRQRPGAWDQLAPGWREATAVAARFVDLRGDPAQGLPPRAAYDLRQLMHGAPVLDAAGDHFVSADPSMRGARKLASVSHGELADARALGAEHLSRVRRHGVHHHGWWYAETPTGPLPDHLARLAERCPAMLRSGPTPPLLVRRLVRTWAWLRFWPALGERFVAAVDRNFERLLPLLAPPLLVAGALRRLAAKAGWRWIGLASTGPQAHGH